MLTKNLTPFAFGTKATFRVPPRREMTVVVRGAFSLRHGEPLAAIDDPLGQGSLSAERFHEDDDERRGECLYGGDFADFKRNGEVLVRATCHAPGGAPAASCPVLVRVGGWSKMLRVVGSRAWKRGLLDDSPTDPMPFSRMPITWANAFGGPGYEKNPAGKGFGTADLPAIENASDVITSRRDRPEPAGLGPVSSTWPARQGKLGKAYGGKAQRAGYYADDFDPSYFQAAPADQQIEGFFRGDEALTFQNLHPEVQILTARLPGTRVRAFVNDVDGVLAEVTMVLDTVFADLDEGKVYLTWRGLTAVREKDLSDVKTLLIAAEKLDGERKPEAHYRAIVEAFERDPVGLEKRLPAGFLDAVSRWKKERAGEAPRPADAGGRDPVSALVHDRFGDLGADEQATAGTTLAPVLPELASRNVDVGAEVQKAVAAAEDEPRPLPIRKPGALPSIGLRRTMRAMLAQVEGLKKSLEGPALSDEARARIGAQIARMEAIPHEPRMRELDPCYVPPEGPVSTDEPGPGRNLAEQDLTGRDLRGLDLRGADLTDAILTRADLRGAKLDGAKLTRAILWRAKLDGADLGGADLERTNAGHASLASAILTGAKLDMTSFEDADLRGAVLREVKGEHATFTRADLGEANLMRADLFHATFGEARLDRADFTGASLVSCDFGESRGEAVCMRGADLSRAAFTSAALPRAVLADIRAARSIWTSARLDGADLRHAVLQAALLDGISAEGASFYGADLARARLPRARLDRAALVRANLFHAILQRASLGSARLDGASLYGANLDEAFLGGASFDGANLKQSTLERA